MKEQSEMEFARAYIRNQQYTKRYSPMEGLQKGTIFPELYMPYGKREKEPVKREPQRERESWRSFGRSGRNG